MAWFVYWHKYANSGLWEYKDKDTALRVAKNLAKQKQVYTIKVVEGSELLTIKDVS